MSVVHTSFAVFAGMTARADTLVRVFLGVFAARCTVLTPVVLPATHHSCNGHAPQFSR